VLPCGCYHMIVSYLSLLCDAFSAQVTFTISQQLVPSLLAVVTLHALHILIDVLFPFSINLLRYKFGTVMKRTNAHMLSKGINEGVFCSFSSSFSLYPLSLLVYYFLLFPSSFILFLFSFLHLILLHSYL